MLISMAYAQEVAADAAVVVSEELNPPNDLALTMGYFFLFALLCYFLLIRPQQKRFKEHQTMLDGLQKGDAVITAGGLIGKIDKLVSDDEVIVDLGGTKVTAVRSTIQSKTDKKPVKTTAKKATKKAAKKAEK